MKASTIPQQATSLADDLQTTALSLENFRLKNQLAEQARQIQTLQQLLTQKQTENETVRLIQANKNLRREIDERKKVEATLQEVARRLNLALESGKVGTCYLDIHTQQIIWDKYTASLFGYDVDDILVTDHAGFLNCVHPEDRQTKFIRHDRIETVDEKSGFYYEYRIIRPDGSIRFIAERGRLYRDEHAEPSQVVGICWDITERKLAEQNLEETTEHLNLALSSAHMGTWSWNLEDNSFTSRDYMRGEMPHIYTGNYEEAITRIYSADQEKVRQAMLQAIEKNTPLDIEHRMHSPDGKLRYIAVRGKVNYGLNGKPTRMVGVAWDITERQQLAEAVRQQQSQFADIARLNSMGELASTLAHELNQPLAAITNYTRGCAIRLENDNYKKEDLLFALKQASQQCLRAGNIIHHMKNFVRQGTLYYETVDLNQIIKDASSLLEYENFTHPALLQFKLTENLPSLEVDKLQISQVILNLLRNASEAMQNAETVNPEIIIKTKLIENNIHVDILDNGPGFPRELLSQLLTPNFSTKKGGMGMGLAICRTIVEAHSGYFIADINPNGGAWFKFGLPIK